MNEKRSLCKPSKESFYKFAQSTTCHGLAHIVDQSEPFGVRCLWVASVVLFLAFATVAVVQSTQKSFVNPTFSTELQPRSMSVGEFPAIHICDSSLFNKTVLEEYGIYDDALASYLVLSFGMTLVSPALIANQTKQSELKQRFEKILQQNSSITVEEIISRAALTCEGMVVSCIVNSIAYSNTDCCDKFLGKFSSQMGSCVSTYFAKEELVQQFPCQTRGFVITLRTNQHPVDFDPTILSPVMSCRKGFVYSASDKITHPVAWMQTEGQLVRPGNWVSVSITRTEEEMEDVLTSVLVKGTCSKRFSSEYSNQTPSFEDYSKKNCFFENSARTTREMANCTIYGAPKTTSPICEPHYIVRQADIMLQKRINASDSSQNHNQQETECVDDCLVSSYVLSPTTTTLDLPFDSSLNSETGVAFHFYYTTFSYTAIVRRYPSIIEWIGELGGNLGLFLGSSLMTAIEVVVLCCHCCFFKKARLNSAQIPDNFQCFQ